MNRAAYPNVVEVAREACTTVRTVVETLEHGRTKRRSSPARARVIAALEARGFRIGDQGLITAPRAQSRSYSPRVQA